MRIRLTSPRNRQRLALFLLLAMLPSLSYMGHWPQEVSIPGTRYDLNVPFVGAPAEPHAGDSHAAHCHGDSAECSDAPFTGAATIALMTESVAMLTLGGLLVAIGVAAWRPKLSLSLAPELQPPRWALSAA